MMLCDTLCNIAVSTQIGRHTTEVADILKNSSVPIKFQDGCVS